MSTLQSLNRRKIKTFRQSIHRRARKDVACENFEKAFVFVPFVFVRFVPVQSFGRGNDCRYTCDENMVKICSVFNSESLLCYY